MKQHTNKHPAVLDSSNADFQQEHLWERAKAAGMTRRMFLTILGAGGAAAVLAACGNGSDPTPTPAPSSVEVTSIPLPPPGATVLTTACDYCVVGCGYKVFLWPVGTEGGPKAAENALNVDYPAQILRGKWISPNMHNIVLVDGVQNHVVVIPDGDTRVVNVRGDHSVRGGTLAQKLYNPDTPTKDRLQQPKLRLGGRLVSISWEEALDLVADLSKYVLEKYDELAWGMKTYSYQYYENTYAITKLALGAVNTPCWAPHDKPAAGADTPGLSDAGVNAFSASYEDWRMAEVIYVSGVSWYETKSIMFQEWVSPGGAKLIVVNPRKDFTAAYAEQREGLHLQVTPGTDTVLNNAVARVILENGWEDKDFIRQRIASADDLAEESFWRRRMFGVTFEQYREFILNDDTYRPESAAEVTGVPADKIRHAAELMAKPRSDGNRPRTSVMLEKGNYWSHNYENTASLASLGLLVGAGGRPGRALARAGGHQRGMLQAALVESNERSY